MTTTSGQGPDPHDDVRMLLGAYVLGGLDPADRGLVDAHLPGCSACRDELASFAALPGLLRHRPFEATPPRPAPDLLPALLREVRDTRVRERRQRLAATLGAVAAAVAVTAAVLSYPFGDDKAAAPQVPVPAVVALGPTPGSTASGQAELTTKGWGTAMTIELKGLPTTGPFVLEVTDASGRAEQAAAWGTTKSGNAIVNGATSIKPGDIAQVRVTGPGGDLVSGRP